MKSRDLIAAWQGKQPSSRATEINFQSRYPGGIVVTKFGAVFPSACPNAGAIAAPPSATAETATRANALSLMVTTPLTRARACLGGRPGTPGARTSSSELFHVLRFRPACCQE